MEVEPSFFRQFRQVDLEKHMKVNVEKGWWPIFVSLDNMHYTWNFYLIVW
jgi:hypothetical protein